MWKFKIYSKFIKIKNWAYYNNNKDNKIGNEGIIKLCKNLKYITKLIDLNLKGNYKNIFIK